MKSAPAPLVSLINASSEFRIVDLYDFTLANGDSLRITSASYPITYPATGTVIPVPGTFYPAIGVERQPVEWTCKPEVQSLSVTFHIDETITLGSVPIAQAAIEGAFDGATMVLYRGFLNSSGILVDVLNHFSGTVADIKPSTSVIEFSVKSMLDTLNQNLPRNLIQPACDHAFLDGGCDPIGTVRAANTTTNAVIGTPTKFVITVSGTHASNFFQLGVIQMTSGDLLDQRRAIRSSVNGGGGHTLTLAIPFPRAPQVGDTCSLIVGCDRAFATCTNKFANQSNFRGFPYVPRPEEQWR